MLRLACPMSIIVIMMITIKLIQLLEALKFALLYACAGWGILLRKCPNHGFTCQKIGHIILLSRWPRHGILL